MSEPELQPPLQTEPQVRPVALEVLVVFVALWLPQMITSYVVGASSSNLSELQSQLASRVTSEAGRCIIILFLIYKSGLPLTKFGFTKLKLSTVGWGLLLTLVLLIVSELVTPFFRHFLPSNESFSVLGMMGGPGFGMIFYLLVGVLYEELIYRSYLQSRLEQVGVKPLYLVLIPALLFGLTHVYQGVSSVPSAVAIGVVLGVAYFKLKSIWPGLICHLLYDGLVYLNALSLAGTMAHR